MNSKKIITFISLSIIVLQICVIFFQINRWNEIYGAIFSICLSISLLFPFGEFKERWLPTLCALIFGLDIVIQLINLILIICLQWAVIQYCLYSNYTIDIAYYGGVACYDWWQYGKFLSLSMYLYNDNKGTSAIFYFMTLTRIKLYPY